MYFSGSVGDALGVLRENKHDVVTKQLMERWEYFYEKDLVGDMDLGVFEQDRSSEGEARREEARREGSRLDKLFRFRDKDHKLPVNDALGSSRRLDLLSYKYDLGVTECVGALLESAEKRSAATQVQALLRGKNARRVVASPNFFKRRVAESAARKKKQKLLVDAVNSTLVVHKFLRDAVARRRAKKAKEARKKELESEGKADDTADDVFEVEFVVLSKDSSLGFKCRAAGEENLERAKKLGLLGKKEIDGLPEVSIVEDGGKAEKMTVAPGDLLLEVGGKPTKLKKLKKAVEKAKASKEDGGGGGVIKVKFMRGARIRAGAKTKVEKSELKGTAFENAASSADDVSESSASEKKEKGFVASVNSTLVVQKFLRDAIARRRAKKAKEARKKEFEKEGKADNTADAVFEVSLVLSKDSSLGFKCRAAGGENLERAKKLGLDGYEEMDGLPEVSSVEEGGKAEQMTVAPGDLLLEVGGRPTKLKKLKKAVEKAKEDAGGGGVLVFKFMRGARIRAGAKTKVKKSELKGTAFENATSTTVNVD